MKFLTIKVIGILLISHNTHAFFCAGSPDTPASTNVTVKVPENNATANTATAFIDWNLLASVGVFLYAMGISKRKAADKRQSAVFCKTCS